MRNEGLHTGYIIISLVYAFIRLIYMFGSTGPYTKLIQACRFCYTDCMVWYINRARCKESPHSDCYVGALLRILISVVYIEELCVWRARVYTQHVLLILYILNTASYDSSPYCSQTQFVIHILVIMGTYLDYE